MKLLPKQENAVYFLKDLETKEVIYGGAAGGGKTAFGVLWILEGCTTYPGSRWLIGRSKLKTLKETTLNTFFEIANRLEISSQFNYNAQSGIIKFNNGSEIILKDLFHYPSDPNYDSLGSLEITGAFIDECNQINYKAWQIVTSRIRYKLNEFDLEPKILGTCNPSKNWVYREFYRPNQIGEISPRRKFIQALPTDNPHLPTSYLESLLALDKNSKERLYYGNWEYDDDPATLIDIDSITDYFTPTHIRGSGKRYITIDVARKGKDKTVFRVWDGWLCIHRYSMSVSLIDQVVNKAKDLQKRFNVSTSNIVADEDGVGGGVVDYLKCKGFVNNSRALNGDNFDNLKSQCSIYMANKICLKEAGEHCVDSSVKDIVSEEMEQVKEKNIDKDVKRGIISKDVVKEKIGRSPDEWDSIMMRYWFELAPAPMRLKKAKLL